MAALPSEYLCNCYIFQNVFTLSVNIRNCYLFIMANCIFVLLICGNKLSAIYPKIISQSA